MLSEAHELVEIPPGRTLSPQGEPVLSTRGSDASAALEPDKVKATAQAGPESSFKLREYLAEYDNSMSDSLPDKERAASFRSAGQMLRNNGCSSSEVRLETARYVMALDEKFAQVGFVKGSRSDLLKQFLEGLGDERYTHHYNDQDLSSCIALVDPFLKKRNLSNPPASTNARIPSNAPIDHVTNRKIAREREERTAQSAKDQQSAHPGYGRRTWTSQTMKPSAMDVGDELAKDDNVETYGRVSFEAGREPKLDKSQGTNEVSDSLFKKVSTFVMSIYTPIMERLRRWKTVVRWGRRSR